jgi:hypothetical protein
MNGWDVLFRGSLMWQAKKWVTEVEKLIKGRWAHDD